MKATGRQYLRYSQATFTSDLSRNRFDVVLRRWEEHNCSTKARRDALGATFGKLRAHGFLNYFGQQRFGSATQLLHY